MMDRSERLALFAACVAMLVLSGAIDRDDAPRSDALDFVGLWRGTYQDKPLSIEFRADGRLILVSSAEDTIGLAGYRITLPPGAPHLDITFDKKDWGTVRTLIERVDDHAIRIAHLDEDAVTRGPFGRDTIGLTRAESHVLPRRAKTQADRDRALADALRGDIWFGGSQRESLLDICEALFRFQFEKHAERLKHNDACLLSIDGRDPPAELLARFKDHDPPVGPESQVNEINGFGFNVRRIVWIDATHVEVRGGTRLSGSIYIMRLEEGQWRVILAHRIWIA
jgi:hypothetical protein